ncbi:MAG: DUF4438 domain-containing protein [Planctomycetota bacterium]|nr:MAG: DUF4438 domain-containing protein [Planctomycetota bacterium]
MLRTNEKKLVEMSVTGQISSPKSGPSPYRVTHDGKAIALPGVGGITYNVKVGDPVSGWQADHVEPCVSSKNADVNENGGFNLLAHVGNRARVVDGDAKGATGIVTGKHGGIEHVLIDFADKDIAKMKIGDKILVRGFGLGLELVEFPGIRLRNISPALLKKIPIKKGKGKKLQIPVTAKVPAKIMGSGLGAQHTHRGDYDIQMFDRKTVKKWKLENLRFGDLVAIMDADHSFGRIYKTGSVSVGVVVHSDCVISGHGPGVTTLFTSTGGMIEPVINKNANIGNYLKIGRWRKKGRKK